MSPEDSKRMRELGAERSPIVVRMFRGDAQPGDSERRAIIEAEMNEIETRYMGPVLDRMEALADERMAEAKRLLAAAEDLLR